MPDLIPANDPFNPSVNLVPVEGNPFALQGDVGAAIQQQNAVEAQRRATAGGLLQHFMTPGRVAQGVQLETPGVMTEEDAFRQNQLEDQARNFGTQQAFNTVFGNVPMSQAGALGSGGGGIKAFHGSPYDFEKFDLGKIGTGEGAQAYGHGLYFAENPAVASDYKNSLSRTKPWEWQGKPVTQYSNDENIPYHVKQAVGWLEGNQRPGESVADLIQRRIKDLSDHAEFMRNSSNSADRFAAGMYDSAVDTLKRVDTDKLKAPTGKMYEVNINADPEHFLDWDKPLSEQHPVVQKAIMSKGDENLTGAQAYQSKSLSFGGMDKLTDAMHEAGIPGIKYLDQGSRNIMDWKVEPVPSNAQNAGQWQVTDKGGNPAYFPDEKTARDWVHSLNSAPTHNYVVFHDKLIDIIKKYGLAGLVAGGASHFTTTPVEHNPFAAQQ